MALDGRGLYEPVQGVVSTTIDSSLLSDGRVKVESELIKDVVLGSLCTIDVAHCELHEGDMYTARHFGTGKGAGQTISIYLKTPATLPHCHLLSSYGASGAAWFRVYEGPTITANTGTNGQVVFNHDRNSLNGSGVFDNATTPVVNRYGIDVTKTGNGTILVVEYSGAARQTGAQNRSNDEFILKSNTAYLFEVESDASGLSLTLKLDWYEHS